jgi:Ca2+-binding RTX toxin-like protein
LTPSFGGPATIAGIERVVGTQRGDVIVGSIGNETLNGLGGNDQVSGDDGNDRLTGAAGNDLLTGGVGRDILFGNAGFDVFDYNAIGETTVVGPGRDLISDFNEFATDIIDLSDLAAGVLTFVGAGPITGLNQVRSFQQGGNTFIDINVAGTNAADARILLSGLHVLDAADFIL